MKETIGETKSLCPICLNVIPAAKVSEDQDVFLEKTCPDHGDFKTLLWRGEPSYLDWGRGEDAPGADVRQTLTVNNCPNDCGLCPEHAAQTCTVLMEVTGRCNLNCPVCFASSSNGGAEFHPDISEIRAMFGAIIDAGGPYPVQLSGGEPTLRDDLPDIISYAKKLGFYHIQVNTHGLRLAKDRDYLQDLKDAGADLIYLQFDGVTDDVYRKIRGADLFDLKVKTIENCAEAKIGVQLVPTLIPGVNDHQIGEMIQFAKQRIPVVKGVHFQPVSYFGRYPKAPADEDRITTPDVLRALEAQTEGEVRAENFLPRRRQDAHCGFSGFFVLQEDNRLKATTIFKPEKPASADCNAVSGVGSSMGTPSEHVRKFIDRKSRFIEPLPTLPTNCACEPQGSLTNIFERARVHYLSISGMPFQDVWTVDLERLQGCCIHVVTPHKRLIPFCAYYLTDMSGHRLPGKGSAEA
ncbi:MAG: radical SAM protein [Deltaproteobacteria bacterium]|nr:radical SAM protein [Deltaproteobacteria bacterium]